MKRSTLPTRLITVVAMFVCAAAAAQDPCMFSAVDHVENTLAWPQPTHSPDTELAVGTERILTCSNSWLRLLDKNGNPVPLLQARLGNDPPPQATPEPCPFPPCDPYPFFFPAGAPQIPGDTFEIVDPMVYFDYEDSRFWVVAMELEFDAHVPYPGRWLYSHVQIAVSTSAQPANWDAFPANPSGAWRKYDYCLRDVDGCQNIDGSAHNETIAVDGDTLYISMHDDEHPVVQQRRTTLMMLNKDELTAGTQATPQFLHLENLPNGQTEGHAVAVEYDAWNNTQPVYTVAPGRPPKRSD